MFPVIGWKYQESPEGTEQRFYFLRRIASDYRPCLSVGFVVVYERQRDSNAGQVPLERPVVKAVAMSSRGVWR